MAMQKNGKVIAAAAIPVLLGYVYIALAWGLADIHARPIINTLRQVGYGQPTAADWGRYEAGLRAALGLAPGNAEFHGRLGNVLEGRYRRTPLAAREAEAVRRQAAEHYRQAIRLRPGWPYDHANLLLVKLRLLELDQEFRDALHAAIRHGPWEPDIRRLVGQIGILTWNILGHAERELILTTLRGSLRHANSAHVQAMRAMIERHGFSGKVCANGGPDDARSNESGDGSSDRPEDRFGGEASASLTEYCQARRSAEENPKEASPAG